MIQKSDGNNLLDTLIYKVRDQDIMLDSDLVTTYQVSTKVINQAVNRNLERFPSEFSFQLSENEWNILRSQSVTSSLDHGGRRYLPRVFTEHGAVMLATVLNSARAIEASKVIVDAFVRLRNAVKQDPKSIVDYARELVAEHDQRLEPVPIGA